MELELVKHFVLLCESKLGDSKLVVCIVIEPKSPFPDIYDFGADFGRVETGSPFVVLVLVVLFEGLHQFDGWRIPRDCGVEKFQIFPGDEGRFFPELFNDPLFVIAEPEKVVEVVLARVDGHPTSIRRYQHLVFTLVEEKFASARADGAQGRASQAIEQSPAVHVAFVESLKHLQRLSL